MNKTGDSEERREACGGGRQLPVPDRRQASRFNSHPQMRLTPDNPESTHCQERFRNPPATHAAGAQGPRRPPEQQPGESHRTLHQPKRPRMPDSAQRADTAPPGPTRDHTPCTPPTCDPSQAGRPTVSAHPRCQAPPPGTQGVAPTPAARPCSMSAPCTQARAEHTL